MMNKIAIVWTVPNKDQLIYWKGCVKSLTNEYFDKEKYVLFLMTDSSEIEIDVNEFADKIKIDVNVINVNETVIAKNDLIHKNGMIWYFLTPYILDEYDLIVSMDNDLIIERDFIKELIKNVDLNNEDIFYGRSANFHTSPAKRFIKKHNKNIMEEISEKQINSGVVVINSKNMRNDYTLESFTDNLITHLTKAKKMIGFKWYCDETIMLSLFWNKLQPSIPSNLNMTVFFKPKDIVENINCDAVGLHFLYPSKWKKDFKISDMYFCEEEKFELLFNKLIKNFTNRNKDDEKSKEAINYIKNRIEFIRAELKK